MSPVPPPLSVGPPAGGPFPASPARVTVAFCPHPPLLVPVVAGAAARETAVLRAACREAVHAVVADEPEVLLVVGDGPAGVRYGRGDVGDLRGFGPDVQVPFHDQARPGGRRLPLAHTIGAWLLDEVGSAALRLGVSAVDLPRVMGELAELPGRIGILAMGDGSARRSEKAPGHLDPAAAPFDDAVARALAEGDADALAGLDPAAGEQLLAAGVPTWRAVGAVLTGRHLRGALRYDDAPFGVGYLVATWRES